jgi:serine/threonine protein kinase
MAPELMRPVEQVRRAEETNIWYPFKVDVYSFGMVCFEILTGDTPYQNNGPEEMRRMILAGERPPLPSHCPSDLQELIKLCWDLEPSARPSFAEICEDLRYIKCSLFLGTSLFASLYYIFVVI